MASAITPEPTVAILEFASEDIRPSIAVRFPGERSLIRPKRPAATRLAAIAATRPAGRDVHVRDEKCTTERGPIANVRPRAI